MYLYITILNVILKLGGKIHNMGMNKMIGIVIADDEQIIRQGLASMPWSYALFKHNRSGITFAHLHR